MIQIEQTSMYKAFMVEKNFRKKVRNLTASLIAVLQIDPYGREFIPVCGQGNEADNSEAIYHWVKNEACCASCIKVLSFQKLERCFVHFLLDNSYQTEYYE